MRKLSEFQKNFILEYFFKNDEYASWKKIATKLLETGKCVVTGNTCIWIGGIGNFIKTSNVDDYFGCLLYEFDLDEFFSSPYYFEISRKYINEINTKISELEKEHSEIIEIFNHYNFE